MILRVLVSSHESLTSLILLMMFQKVFICVTIPIGNYCKSTMDPGKSGNKQLVENRKLFDLSQRGIIHEEDGVIEFKDVPIVTPSGEILVSFVIQ